MGFTLDFAANLGQSLLDGAPLFAALASLISGLAILVGRREGWSISDSLYFGFITATTVGYGDMRPSRGSSKALAILLALVGLVMTGIIVGLAVEAASSTYEQRVVQ